ncbi:MAG: hypothetical protein HZY78_09815 [Burkholderiaceae bacterium]|nr:MAG: hypothetical protein HZY78_09815 [Burkholderiaceae bacterium]
MWHRRAPAAAAGRQSPPARARSRLAPTHAPTLQHLIWLADAPLPKPLPPQLRQLLTRLAPAPRCEAAADAPEAAHEQALARLLGLSGPAATPAPWAALHAHALGLSGAGTSAWAWLSLCHWQVGMDHVFMHDPGALALGAAEAQALGAALEPLLAGDGLRLHPLPASGPADPPAGVSPLWRSVLDAVRPRGALWLVEGERCAAVRSPRSRGRRARTCGPGCRASAATRWRVSTASCKWRSTPSR